MNDESKPFLDKGVLDILILTCWFGIALGLSVFLYNFWSEPYSTPIFIFAFCTIMGNYFTHLKKELKSESKTKKEIKWAGILMDRWFDEKPRKRRK
jgi:hypothetical protein